MDGFDRLPDSLVHLIFDSVSDTKTLIRCRLVSKRFNSLVPQTESLLLKVDRVISATESDEHDNSFFLAFLKSIVKTVRDVISQNSIVTRPVQNSPSQILRCFDRIRNLEIELPAGDLRLEKGAVIRWKAVYGRNLKNCVILGIHSFDTDTGDVTGRRQGIHIAADETGGGLKARVIWTISALIAASARHYMLNEVIKQHKEMVNLVVTDKEGEGKVVMDKEGLNESIEHFSDDEVQDKNRTTVPAVRMRMRHEPWLELKGGVRVNGATLVVVRPMVDKVEVVEEDDGRLALGAFDGVYGEVVQALLKSRSYMLEMNSF